MKVYRLQLTDVEAAMLVEVQKVNRAYRDPEKLLLNLVRREYIKNSPECAK